MKTDIRTMLVTLAAPFMACVLLLADTFVARGAPPQNTTNKTWVASFDYPTNYMAAISNAVAVPGTSTNATIMKQLTNVVYRFYMAPQFQGANTQWSLILTTNNPPATSDKSSILVQLPSLPLQQVFLCASISNSFGEFFFTAPTVVPLVPPDPSVGYSLQSSP